MASIKKTKNKKTKNKLNPMQTEDIPRIRHILPRKFFCNKT